MDALTILFFVLTLGMFSLFLWQRWKYSLMEEELERLRDTQGEDLLGKGKFSELGLMSAGIAHEISNPLTVIQNRAVQLQRIYRMPEMEKEMAKGLQQIHYHSERLAKIVHGIRQYIYRNDELLEEQIPLVELIESVMLFIGQRLKNHGIELRLHDLDGIYLNGHRGQLEQAIMNLINNSFDAIDSLPEKWIEICAVQENDLVDIYFKDSGHGIPAEICAHMLEPFYTSKKSRGSGLGLPLVKGIAEKHGGSFEYVAKAENTTFLLEFPRAA